MIEKYYEKLPEGCPDADAIPADFQHSPFMEINSFSDLQKNFYLCKK